MGGFYDALTAWLKEQSFGITIRFKQTGFKQTKEIKMPPEYKYFKPEEVEGLDENFVAKLDLARKFAEIPFVITSGLRTLEKNESIIGAVPDSAHLTGKAVDLEVHNSHEVYRIIAAGVSVGIMRYGIYVDSSNMPTHVHMDADPNKVSEVIWIKGEGQAATAPASA